jgi:hypothetical protein
MEGTSKDSDPSPTQLQAVIYPAATDEHDSPVDDEQIKRIKNLITEYGFDISDNSYYNVVLTKAFISTEKNIDKIKEIKATLDEWYSENDVSYGEVSPPDGDFEVIHSITVEDKDH